MVFPNKTRTAPAAAWSRGLDVPTKIGSTANTSTRNGKLCGRNRAISPALSKERNTLMLEQQSVKSVQSGHSSILTLSSTSTSGYAAALLGTSSVTERSVISSGGVAATSYNNKRTDKDYATRNPPGRSKDDTNDSNKESTNETMNRKQVNVKVLKKTDATKETFHHTSHSTKESKSAWTVVPVSSMDKAKKIKKPHDTNIAASLHSNLEIRLTTTPNNSKNAGNSGSEHISIDKSKRGTSSFASVNQNIAKTTKNISKHDAKRGATPISPNLKKKEKLLKAHQAAKQKKVKKPKPSNNLRTLGNLMDDHPLLSYNKLSANDTSSSNNDQNSSQQQQQQSTAHRTISILSNTDFPKMESTIQMEDFPSLPLPSQPPHPKHSSLATTENQGINTASKKQSKPNEKQAVCSSNSRQASTIATNNTKKQLISAPERQQQPPQTPSLKTKTKMSLDNNFNSGLSNKIKSKTIPKNKFTPTSTTTSNVGHPNYKSNKISLAQSPNGNETNILGGRIIEGKDGTTMAMKKANIMTQPNGISFGGPLPSSLSIQKGRQRLKPRKKRLTSLKKKVLQERLAQWRERQGESGDQSSNGADTGNSVGPVLVVSSANEGDTSKIASLTQSSDASDAPAILTISATTTTTAKNAALHQDFYSTTVHLLNFVHVEELKEADEDELDEILSDLRDLAEKVGPVHDIFIPALSTLETTSVIKSLRVFVHFVNVQDAIAARACWDGMVIGGNVVIVGIVSKRSMNEILNEEGQFGTIGNNIAKDVEANDWRRRIIRLSEERLSMPSLEQEHVPGGKDKTNIDDSTALSVNNESTHMTTIVLNNILTEDDFEDEDCLHESLDDIISLARKYGHVVTDRTYAEVSGELKGQVKIVFLGGKDIACSAVKDLNGMILGGKAITAYIEEVREDCTEKRNQTSDITSAKEPLPPNFEDSSTLIIQNILTEDDYEDEECMEESQIDIRDLTSKFGLIRKIHIDSSGNTKGRVCVCYDAGEEVVLRAVKELHGLIIGGKKISVSSASDKAKETTGNFPTSNRSKDEGNYFVILQNLLTEDDYEDEECLEETKKDIWHFAQKYGCIQDLSIELDGDKRGQVLIDYGGSCDVATKAAKELDGFVIGGERISAILFHDQTSTREVSFEEVDVAEADTENLVQDQTPPAPIFSGDKRIPERYAECKRVPKIPNPGLPRKYASRIDDTTVVPLLTEMLGELMRLQLRSKDDKNARARRRLVLGLREVARGIRAHKVKMVIMANNLDEYGAIDSKLQEILDLARQENLPVLFEFNKRKLGKALGKNLKVSVVGIQNADGAHEQFKKLKKITSTP